MGREAEGSPASGRIDGPESLRKKRRDPHPDAASRLSIAEVRVGDQLSADPLDYENTETEEALKRAAENDRRS